MEVHRIMHINEKLKLQYLLQDLQRNNISEWDIEFVKELLKQEQKNNKANVLKTLKSIRASLIQLGASQYDVEQITELIKNYDNNK